MRDYPVPEPEYDIIQWQIGHLIRKKDMQKLAKGSWQAHKRYGAEFIIPECIILIMSNYRYHEYDRKYHYDDTLCGVFKTSFS